jgi:hypothetical protein
MFFRYVLLAVLAMLVSSSGALAQLQPDTQRCFSMPTQDCLLSEAAAAARGAPIKDLAVGGLANVARTLAKLGHKEQAGRAFAEADALAKAARPISGSGTLEYLVVRAMFDAGLVDEAMLRAKEVKGPGIAEAAIDALLTKARLAEAETFLSSTQAWNIETYRAKLAEAYAGAGSIDKASSLIQSMPEARRVSGAARAGTSAEKAGRADVVAALLASLPDEAARQAARQSMLQQSSAAAFSSALEKNDLDEAVKILARAEMATTRPALLISTAIAACKGGKSELARKLGDDARAAMATMKVDPNFVLLTIRRGVLEAQCKEHKAATATFVEAKTLIDGQPEGLRRWLIGVLAQGYVTAGNVEAALETAKLAKNQATMTQLLSALAKAGNVREALAYVQTQDVNSWPELLVALAEHVPRKPAP